MTDRELAWGKIAGYGMIVGTGLIVCLAIVARGGQKRIAGLLDRHDHRRSRDIHSPVSARHLVLGAVSRRVGSREDRIGGNPHPLPMIAGTLCTALFARARRRHPLRVEYLLRQQLRRGPADARVVLSPPPSRIPLINLAAHTDRRRRENLALVAQGK